LPGLQNWRSHRTDLSHRHGCSDPVPAPRWLRFRSSTPAPCAISSSCRTARRNAAWVWHSATARRWRRVLSRLWAPLLGTVQHRAALRRLELHPGDWDHPARACAQSCRAGPGRSRLSL
jgi:hypothetical protein